MTRRVTFVSNISDHRQLERDALQRDVDAFLARGGTIQVLPQGAVSEVSAAEVKEARRKEAIRKRAREKQRQPTADEEE